MISNLRGEFILISKNFLGKVLMFSALAVSPILMSSSKVEASQRSVGNRYGVQNQVSFSDKKSALADLIEKGLKLLDQDPSLYQPGVYKYKLKYQLVDDSYNFIGDLTTPQTGRINYVSDYKYNLYVVVEGPNGENVEVMLIRISENTSKFKCERTSVVPGDEEYSDIDSKYKIVCAMDEISKYYWDEGTYFKSPYDMIDVDDSLEYKDDFLEDHLKNIFGLKIPEWEGSFTSDDEIISPEVDDSNFLA